MSDQLVRVKHKITGHEYTVPQAVAVADKNLAVIEKEAVDENGRPRFPKPHTSVRGTVNTVRPQPDAGEPVAVELSEPAAPTATVRGAKRTTIKES